MTDALDKQVGGNHYKHFAIQPAEYCQRNNLNSLESTVIKYVSRHRFKNGVEDIDKAIHCLELLKEIDYPIAPIPPPAPMIAVPPIAPAPAPGYDFDDDIPF